MVIYIKGKKIKQLATMASMKEMQTNQLSLKHSAGCFLNSLFREWSDFYHDSESSSFVIKLKDEGMLVIPVEYYSLVGRHSYPGYFYYRKNKNSEASELNFTELVVVLLDHLSSIYQTSPEQLKIFSDRIVDSVHNIESSLSLRAEDLRELYKSESIDFKDAEQALMIGHTFHPHPKNRDEFSEEDYKKYSPEAAGNFNLQWFMAHESVTHSQISKNFEKKNWSDEVFLKENLTSESYKKLKEEGYVAYPVHPWQKHVLLKMPIIQEYLAEGLIVDFGVAEFSEEKWYPTSSLRSIYNQASPYMLKFSLSVRLTNSIRHMLPSEVVRGLQVLDVFSTSTGKTFLNSQPDFHILFEPAFMALVDRDKKILNETIVSLRENSFKSRESQKIVVATLTQDNPLNGASLIGNQIQRASRQSNKTLEFTAETWFTRFLQVAVRPLMMAQANYGILLGAHQQNLILEIRDNMPSTSYFRDCHGTGYSKTGFELFSKEVDLMTVENGNILDDKMGNALFAYYLVINTVFNVISAIAKDAQITEEQLMKIFKVELINWRASGVKDTSCFDYLLDNPKLLQKGNFLCSFVNMNENTTDNPLGIYNEIPNPIHGINL